LREPDWTGVDVREHVGELHVASQHVDVHAGVKEGDHRSL
jgi:hypothetical protein